MLTFTRYMDSAIRKKADQERWKKLHAENVASDAAAVLASQTERACDVALGALYVAIGKHSTDAGHRATIAGLEQQRNAAQAAYATAVLTVERNVTAQKALTPATRDEDED